MNPHHGGLGCGYSGKPWERRTLAHSLPKWRGTCRLTTNRFIGRLIARYEGNYGWDPHDPGGPTNMGITCFDLADFMHEPMDSMARWAPIVRGYAIEHGR